MVRLENQGETVKALYIPMDDDDHERLLKAKKASGKKWREFIMELAK